MSRMMSETTYDRCAPEPWPAALWDAARNHLSVSIWWILTGILESFIHSRHPPKVSVSIVLILLPSKGHCRNAL